jgi:hypothetical protein
MHTAETYFFPALRLPINVVYLNTFRLVLIIDQVKLKLRVK